MKINRRPSPAPSLIALVLASVLVLTGCSGSPPQLIPVPRGGTAAPQPQPQPQPAPPPRPAPPPPAPRADAQSWRDLPQTSGSWTYSAESTGSALRFGQPGAAPLLVMRCDRTRPAIVLQRPGLGTGDVPATITTSAASRRMTAGPAQNAAGMFEIAFAVRDPLLDAMAFSRGRFLFEMGGAQTLVLPAWSELGRVIEDCR